MAKEIAEEYTSSLADLTLNSKPLINMLTMLADDNIEHAEAIVQAVEKHLEKVRSEYKLPVLYLIDSIVKNVGRAYTQLFTQNIVNTFCSVFEKVDEKVRAQMFKLRQTWNEVFPAKKLYTLDIRVQCIDPAWPITAPSPTPSIHVNPKFFNKPATPPATIVPPVTNPTATAAVAAAAINLDPATLDMHTQLINKQKELLELKQKKLELELLQAKAKLEEQQKQLQIHTAQIKPPATTTPTPNLLLKPEVSKQLNQAGGLLGVKPPEKSSKLSAQNTQVQATSARSQQSSVPTLNNSCSSNSISGTPRIAPVNSAMIAASVRSTVRDPRLLRGGGGGTTTGIHPMSTVPSQLSTQITSNTNNFENVNIDDKKVKTKSINNSTINIDCGVSSDKTSSLNKSDNTLNRKDPRLLNNKAPGSSTINNKNKSNNGRPVSSERSPTKTKNSPNQSRKSLSASSLNKSNSNSSTSTTSRSFKNSNSDRAAHKIQLLDAGTTASNESCSVSSSNKSVNSSSTKSSPTKYRKDKKSGEHSDKSVEQTKQRTKNHKTSESYTNTNASNISNSSTSSSNSNNNSSSNNKTRSRDRERERDRDRSDKYDDESSTTTTSSTISPITTTTTAANQLTSDQRTFKGLKGTTKNRNYMRRNRAVSISPEPSQDVDLRVCAPPEKQPRLQQNTDPEPEDITKSTTLDDISPVKDVDLRTLVPLAINKKRSSTEKLEASNAKKSKSQMFDVLFGNEDVDLRQLPIVTIAGTVTPSVPTTITTATTSPSAVKRPPTPPPPIISTISEKAEPKQKGKATNADKTEWNAIRAKLAKATKKSSLEDRSENTDLRKKSSVFGSNGNDKIIISKDDEQKIKEGNLSQALVEKVLTLFETQKLQEAQRRESEEFKTNVTLQPISDDELSVDFSHSDSDDEPKIVRKSDRDERVAPPAPMITPQEQQQQQQKDNKQNHLDARGVNSRVSQNVEHNWHHRRRKMIKSHWDSPPQHHATPEPWIRPPPAVLNQALYGQVSRRPFAPFMRSSHDNFGGRMETVVPSHILDTNRTGSPPTIGSQNTRELPPADPLVLEYIDKDTMRAINIDGRLREIRYYEETAIAIMSWDDPREITFQNGTRLVTFDDKESYMLSFNDVYKDVTIGGKAHRIRLGAPTRELYIDGKWYECFFGGPGIGIEIDGKICVVKLDGPPPHVKIGSVKRNDLVAGKISLIINARTMIPIFLDAKPQKFDIEGKLHTLRFVDALRTVLINEVPFKVEFGGLPKPITVHDKKHFIRFSILPKGIKPGYVKIANMEGQRFSTPPRNDENSNDAIIVENITTPMSVNEPALPMLGKRKMRTNPGESSPDRNSPIMQNSSLQSLGSLDVLSSIMTSPSTMTSSTNISGYQVEATQDSQDGFPVITNKASSNEIPGLTATMEQPPAAAPPSLPFNINELFELLVTTGVITTETTQKPTNQPLINKDGDCYIKPVLFSHPETLKVRQQNIVTTLYSGMQCSSCGVRFPPEHSMQYSQHLDWHFRQNRRGRNSARKALCRKWYYQMSDWKNYEEIEDIEEREKNWFESQQEQQQTQGQGDEGEEEIEIPSVTADSNSQETCCEVCHDKFEQFYNEEKEEWHLRMAIRVDDKTYHPLCYDDHKASLLMDTLQHTSISENEDHKDTETIESTKTEEEDEDDVEEVEIIKTDKEEVEEGDEKMEVDEPKEENSEEVIPEDELNTENDAKIDDDEVIIQEPKIEQIIIDDNLDDDEEESNDIKTDLFPAIKIKEEPMDDTEICIANIKTEPLDPEEEIVNSVIPADTTSAEILTSIDGNVQLNMDTPISVANTIPGKIKINITKPIHAAPKETTNTAASTDSDMAADTLKDNKEPLPPGEEPVQLNLKPALQGLSLTKQPAVYKGNELTGLCSIM